MGNTETDRRSSLLWDRILGSLEEDLAERRARKLVVRVRGESGPYEKEIGEFSAAERRSLDPVLGEHVAEQLLDRYLAEKGYVELIDKSYAYRKKIGDLTPADLPALVEAERERIEERRERHERAKFVQDMRAAVDQLQVGELAEMAEAPRSRRVALDGGVDRGVPVARLAAQATLRPGTTGSLLQSMAKRAFRRTCWSAGEKVGMIDELQHAPAGQRSCP